jgi:hypothetical protein
VLILAVAIFVSAQSEPPAKESSSLEPRLDASIGLDTNETFEALLDSALQGIKRRASGDRLHIVNYGTFRELGWRERKIYNHIDLVGFDRSLVSVARGGSLSPIRTDFWIIPKGGELPKLKPEPWIGMEFGVVDDETAQKNIREFFDKAYSDRSQSMYIINYGSDAEIRRREKSVAKNIGRRPEFPEPRITLVRGGNSREAATVMWIIPPGANPPEP